MARRMWGIELPSRMGGLSVYTVILDSSSDCSRDALIEALNASGWEYVVVKDDYEKLNAVAIALPDSLLDWLRMNDCVVDLFPGVAPDEDNINNYMNWEHPPLAKYVLVLSMLILGNNELAWRLPSLVLALAMWTAIVVVVYRLSGRGLGFIVASLVLVAGIVFDRSFTILSSIAMLDIYVASLTVLALWAGLQRKPLLSAILVGLAGSAKFTGFFAIPWLYVASRWSGRSTRASLAISLFVPLLVYLVLCLPVIAYLGLGGWVSEVIGALKWHTTSRETGPPSTTAWGLLIGDTPFPLYYVGWLLYLYVTSTPAIAVVALVSGIGASIALIRRVKDVYLPSTLFMSVVAGYFLVYLAGNHTLYSFYSAHFMPIAIITAALFPLPRSDQLDEAIRVLRSLVRGEPVYNTLMPEISRAVNLVMEKPGAVAASTATAAIIGYVWFTMGGAPGCDYGLNLLFCRVDDKMFRFVLVASVVMYALLTLRETVSSDRYAYTILVLTPLLLVSGLPDAYTLFLPLLFAAHRVGLDSLPLAAIAGLMSPSYAYAYLATTTLGLIGFIVGHTLVRLVAAYSTDAIVHLGAVDIVGLAVGVAGYLLLRIHSPLLRGERGRALLSPLALTPHFTPLLIEPYAAWAVREGRFLTAVAATMLTLVLWVYARDNIVIRALVLSAISVLGVVVGYAESKNRKTSGNSVEASS